MRHLFTPCGACGGVFGPKLPCRGCGQMVHPECRAEHDCPGLVPQLAEEAPRQTQPFVLMDGHAWGAGATPLDATLDLQRQYQNSPFPVPDRVIRAVEAAALAELRLPLERRLALGARRR